MAKSTKTIFCVLLTILFPFFMQAESPKLKIPDFAYPQTVEGDAAKLLAEADRMGGTEASALRVRALLELTTAQLQIDRDNAYTQPALIAAQAAKEGAASPGRAMLLVLEAQKYFDIYNSRRWTYDRVSAPLEPYPADVSEWSALQFHTRVAALVDSAIAVADAAPVTPLADFSDCLEYSSEALSYVPDVASFVRYKAYKLLKDCGKAEEAKALAEKTMAMSTPGSAPYFYWAAKATDDLEKLYEKWADNESARYVLLQLVRSADIVSVYWDDFRVRSADTGHRDNMIGLLRASLERFPGWYANNDLRNELARLTKPELEYSFPRMQMPGKPFDVVVSYSFAKNVDLAVYRLPAMGMVEWNPENIAKSCPKVFSASIAPTAVDGTDTVSVSLAEPGEYAVLALLDGEPNSQSWQRPVILVTPMLAFSLNAENRNAAVAVDFESGKPLKGVTVTENGYSHRRNAPAPLAKLLGKTSSEGTLLYTPTEADYSARYLSFGLDGREYDFGKDVDSREPADYGEDDDFKGLLFTDRKLYHQGDSISWALVAAVKEDGAASPRVFAGEKVNIVLRDANGKVVDTLEATTDSHGRVSGAFPTRKDALSGRYTLVARMAGHVTSAGVEVSDFKLPTFEVEISKIERGVPAEGAVRISGRARTFTGMPVASANVKLVLSEAYRWRWFAPMREIATLDTVTGFDGTFSFDIPASTLDGGATRPVDFYAAVTVTSLAAEASEASRGFTVGKPYTLQIFAPYGNVDGGKASKGMIEAYNADGEQKPVEVRWTLGVYKDNECKQVVAQGSATTGTPFDMNLASVPAGVYVLEASPADSTLASAVRSEGIVVYNLRRNDVPDTGSPVFVPVESYSADGKVKLLVGTSQKEAFAIIAVNDNGKLASLASHKISHGFHTIDVAVPAGKGRASIVVYSVRDGAVSSAAVNVERADKRDVKLVAESFRDKLVPGSGEQWRFRLLDSDSAPVANAAMIATLYNRALDKLSSPSWPSGMAFNNAGGWISFSAPSAGRNSFSLYGNIKDYPAVNTVFPAFMFWETELYNSLPQRKLMASASGVAVRGAYDDVMLREEIVAAGIGSSNDLKAEKEEDGVEESEPDVEYRVAETLQVLWEPRLTADAEGNIDIVFTMPDAIGGWSFKGFAWSDDARAAAYAAECVSSKPVMVQPNLPRFLRQGDKATIRATVFNNSGENGMVTTTMELFDPATATVKSSSTVLSTLAAGASTIVGIPVEAPADASAIGFRVRSVLGSFADGEQALVPVLASSATVVESTEFYLNPGDSKPFELTVPAATDATITLQYCQNPVWTVVKAMRGLSDGGSTSTEYVGRLFSALAGRKIISESPAVAAAIKQWSDNPSEDALKSMLEKNEDLKKLMLDQTPWVQAAASQSARMAALAQFLEPEAVEKSVNAAVEGLSKLQNKDGGFVWGDWNRESSEWATQTVLTTLGIANSLGMLPQSEQISGMIDAAFGYLQKEAAKPGRSLTNDNLALISALLPQAKLTVEGSAIVRRTVARIVSGWRKDGTVGKAYDILILKANGRKAVAAQILESIRQHSVVKPGMGMCFPNVDDIRTYASVIQAFAAMDAPKAEIDAMRQWITVRAQAIDNLGAYNPDYVVAAVMLTGSVWTDVPVSQNVTVDGRPLAIGRVESSTGYFAQTIPADGKAVTIKVTPNGVTPSYGSVVSVGRRPMASVEARPGRDISVEKRVLVERAGSWVETNEFNLGERVRVQLVIKAKRDLQYVSIDDERPAAFEPVEQLPGYVYDGGLGFYRENRDASTRLFVGWLPKGTYHVNYDMTAALEGCFISGIATLQSQYAPELTAHSGASVVTVTVK